MQEVAGSNPVSPIILFVGERPPHPRVLSARLLALCASFCVIAHAALYEFFLLPRRVTLYDDASDGRSSHRGDALSAKDGDPCN